MFGLDLLTIIVIGAVLVTAFILWLSYILSDGGSENASIIVLISGVLLAIEVIYLIIRFIKFVWFL